jgi:hypothetical protein
MIAAAASISIRRNSPPPHAQTLLPTNPQEAAAAQAHG